MLKKVRKPKRFSVILLVVVLTIGTFPASAVTGAAPESLAAVNYDDVKICKNLGLLKGAESGIDEAYLAQTSHGVKCLQKLPLPA